MKSDSPSSTRDVATGNEAKDTSTAETAQVRFTKGWTRPEFEKINPAGQQFPCLVCGRHPAGKKCGRCRSATYCSVECQEMDYTTGGHKSNCKLLKSLFEEKEELEKELESPEEGQEEESASPAVGQFWLEVTNPFSPLYDSSRQPSASKTTRYCVCLLQLVQILGRGESWRVKKTNYHPTVRIARAQRDEETNEFIEPDRVEDSLGDSKYLPPEAGNALALVMALDIGLDLLYLDRTDLRVRLCIPSLYLELGMLQEAYDFVKFWLLPSSTAMLEALVQNEYDHMGDIVDRPYLNLSGENMTEKPESWAEFLAFYPSVGMVFEMALIKIKLADRARRSAETNSIALSPDDSSDGKGKGPGVATNIASTDAPSDNAMNSSADELERQARLLLSCVHKLNPHLLPPMGGYRPSSCPGGPPAAVTELLNHTPGMDLQYRMGNAGGGSKEEAIGVWQKDMVVWDNDKVAMEFLSTFASDLEHNLVPIPADASRVEAMTKAKSLADKLKEKNPAMSADQIMMHPEMAKLMIEQLQEERKNEEK